MKPSSEGRWWEVTKLRYLTQSQDVMKSVVLILLLTCAVTLAGKYDVPHNNTQPILLFSSGKPRMTAYERHKIPCHYGNCITEGMCDRKDPSILSRRCFEGCCIYAMTK
ncbi:hypothetical protein Btru_005071 [Bulinus truncatus]|nr:hypothetical protein Btru_005071 [Bulinus truncatus]